MLYVLKGQPSHTMPQPYTTPGYTTTSFASLPYHPETPDTSFTLQHSTRWTYLLPAWLALASLALSA